MSTNNFREPVEYVIKRYVQRSNLHIVPSDNNSSTPTQLNLPDYPCRIVRDIEGKVSKAVYAEGTSQEWSEELIRDMNGKVYQIRTTFPDLTSNTVEIFKGATGAVESIDFV